MAASNGSSGPIDGRTARAARTHDAIVQACLDLVDEGDLRPTGPRIAERAGVSVRSIFQHFADLDELFGAVGAKVSARIAASVEPLDTTGPLADRIDALVDRRAQVFEIISPVLRAAIVHASASDVVKKTFDQGHRFFQTQVCEVFEDEIEATDDAELLIDALVIVLGWASWETLRTAQGCSVDEARRRLSWMTRATVQAAGFEA